MLSDTCGNTLVSPSQTFYTVMDCPTGLDPDVPPLEEDTLEQLALKIKWHEWKVETDTEKKRQLQEKERQLRENKSLLLKLQLKDTTGKLSPLGVACRVECAAFHKYSLL